jgi:hypothetical protein
MQKHIYNILRLQGRIRGHEHSYSIPANGGICKDLGFDVKFDKKTEKYSPLIPALRKYLGRVEYVAFPIGHAGTTLTRTLAHLTATFSTVRPPVERSRASKGASNPATDHNAKAHDFTLFKSLPGSITDLAQSRLLGIIRNRSA